MTYIMDRLVPEWSRLFAQKQHDYGENGHEDLGIRAQFVDINRKTHKLRRALWDGVELQGEQPREILMDLIGHCFLTIDLLDEESLVQGRRDYLDKAFSEH